MPNVSTKHSLLLVLQCLHTAAFEMETAPSALYKLLKRVRLFKMHYYSPDLICVVNSFHVAIMRNGSFIASDSDNSRIITPPYTDSITAFSYPGK